LSLYGFKGEFVIKRIKLSQIYFGWWATLFGGILSGLGAGIFIRGASVFLLPVGSEFGLTRASASVAAGIGSVCNGLMFPLAGWLSDKYGPKWVATIGIFIMGAGLVLMNFVNSIWSYYIIWGVMVGAGHGFGFTVAHDKILTNWFVSKRGIALGSRFAIMGVMEMAAVLMISPLIATQGWRLTSLTCAGLIFVIGIPVVLFFVKQERPEYYGLLPDGATLEPGVQMNADTMLLKGVEYAAGFQETEFSIKQALRTLSYWMLTAAFIIQFMIFQGFNLHCIPFLVDFGIDPIKAAGMMAMMVFFVIPSRLLVGIVADRMKKGQLNYLLALVLLLPAAGMMFFIFKQTIFTIYLFLILFGIGTGAFIPLHTMINARYFGRESFGSLMGITKLFTVPGLFLSSVYVGMAYDLTGSYIPVLKLFATISVLVVCLTCMVKIPRINN